MTFDETLNASRLMKGPLGAAAFVLTEALRRAGAEDAAIAPIVEQLTTWMPKLSEPDRAELVAVLQERLEEVDHKDAFTDMVRLAGQLTSLEAHLAHDALGRQGLFSRLAHERTGAAVIPSLENEVEVWVRPEALAAAQAIIEQLGAEPTGEQITCSKCNEQSPAHFGFCWACGADITKG